MLNKQQWRTIRRLLGSFLFYLILCNFFKGKPRRCSPQFFDEERQALELRRNKIRAIYDGTYVTNPNFDFSDLPQLLPRPLVVGMRVSLFVYVYVNYSPCSGFCSYTFP